MTAFLRHSLQIFRGITARREQKLWDSGIVDWDALERTLEPQQSLFENSAQSIHNKSRFEEARSALESESIEFFATRLERREHYRIALAFPSECMFLDIETTGLSRYYDHITVIGWARGSQLGFYVRGQSDSAFRQAIASARCIITFNGSLFDLPFIKQEFPELQLPIVHIDLRFLSKRVGLTGGQKAIEQQIRRKRKGVLQTITGEIAPVLWHQYTKGDVEPLRTLLQYNAADVQGMMVIFDAVAPRLLKKIRFPQIDSDATKEGAFEAMAASQNIDRSIESVLSPYPAIEPPHLRIEDIVFVDRLPRLRVVGIDLTGAETRPSGWCLLDGRDVTTARLGSDDEIVARTVHESPHIVSIDSPLSLPEGRVSVHDSDPGRQEFGIMRFCERQLKRRGVNVYPALIPSMQRLTARGIALASRFRAMGLPVIESYPGAAQDILRIPRKRKGLQYLEEGLASFGVSGPFVKGDVSHDELDAITSAVVGVFFWAAMAERLGPDPLGDEALIIPDLRIDHLESRQKLLVGFSGALGAGKTTAARYLEQLGFRYCRFSEVIERLVADRGQGVRREALQIEGLRVHKELGQRWLVRELLRPNLEAPFLVIDGLRFPEDHAFLTELAGAQFLHIHVVAPRSTRKRRFIGRAGRKVNFNAQDVHAVEQNVGRLAELARDVIDNRSELETFHTKLDELLARNWKD